MGCFLRKDVDVSLQHLFLTILVVCLHMWTEQATVILMATKIQIIISNGVNPILSSDTVTVILSSSLTV